MRRFVVLFLLLMVAFVSVVQAQTPATAPKPDPEVKKMQPWVGHWTYEQEYKAGPLGPGSKVTGESKVAWILGGFFQEAWSKEKGAKGMSQTLEIDGYDSVNKKFTYAVFLDDGNTTSGTFSLSSTTEWSFEGKLSAGGKQYSVRGKGVFAADMKSYTFSGEISTDGKTWVPWWEAKYTKSEPAAKK